MANKQDTGVYFLADDGAYEWTVALLESLRMTNPQITLWCVPFSDRLSKISRLKSHFRFEIYEDTSFPVLEDIAKTVNNGKLGKLHGMYRKLSMFWGPLRQFIYLDSDIIITDNLMPILEILKQTPHDLVWIHSDIDKVYTGALQQQMVSEYGAIGINAGAFLARSGILSLEEIQSLAQTAKNLISEFAETLDQPFLNYCLDRKRIKMASLSELTNDTVYWNWPGEPVRLQVTNPNADSIIVRHPDGRRVLGVHWAGYSLNPQMPYYELYRRYRLHSVRGVERIQWNVERTLPIYQRKIVSRFGGLFGRIFQISR